MLQHLLSPFLTFELIHFWGLNIIKVQYSGYFGQLLLLFHTNQFKTLHAFLSWSLDVHVVLALSSI